MMEFGICPGIENYSRIFAGKAPGSTPYTLLDYFPKDFLLLFVGNVTSIKNLNLSLEAFYKLQQNHSNLKFAIIGDGVDRTKYENYCKKQNIQDKVIFTGRISNTEVLSSIFARTRASLSSKKI